MAVAALLRPDAKEKQEGAVVAIERLRELVVRNSDDRTLGAGVITTCAAVEEFKTARDG